MNERIVTVPPTSSATDAPPEAREAWDSPDAPEGGPVTTEAPPEAGETPPEDTRPDPEEVAESLTGFDEIAIERMFRKDPSDLGGTMMLRAMSFILLRRTGMKDNDAFRKVMNDTLAEITSMFRDDVKKQGDEDGEDFSEFEGKA